MKQDTQSSLKWRKSLYAFLLYGGLCLIFTFAAASFGPQDAQVGGVRPENTILPHLAGLAAFGLALGLGSFVVYGRKGLPLVFLIPTLTVLLDIDHLPVYLGYAEPIRPAHSLVFLLSALALAAITIKELDIELAMVTAFMAHLTVDTGQFAPFSPITFDYFELDPYRLYFGIGAVIATLATGVALKMRSRGKTNV